MIKQEHYSGYIEWLIDNNNQVMGKVNAVGVNVANLPVHIIYVDHIGSEETHEVTTDINGQFTDYHSDIANQYAISAIVYLTTPTKNTLCITSKVLQMDIARRIFMVTENKTNYLITEDGQYFIGE